MTESEAKEQYYVWCINAGTKDEKGLRNRRKKEADLFFSGIPDEVIVTPTISTDKASYNVGDTVYISWTASPSGSNLSHYWLNIIAPDGTLIYGGTMNKETSYSYVVSQAGDYSITTYATPIASLEGEGSLTDTKIVSVSNPVPAPTYSNLTANKTMIAVGEEITFTASSDYATGFTIGIDNETSCYIIQKCQMDS